MEITLYYAPNAFAVAQFAQAAEFLARVSKNNPKHKVPALMIDGKILTE